jgi:nucleoside-diphosphate-sugar epimerase
MKKSILVTGAAGFIGYHLCNFYLKKGYEVIGVDNLSTGSLENISDLSNDFQDSFLFFNQDVSVPWTFLESLKNKSFEFVFHFASPAAVNQYQNSPLETMWANSIGLKNALEFADAQSARLVFSSTSEIYGSDSTTPQSEKQWGSVNSFGERSCYDESKRFGEALIFSWNKINKTKHGLVRIFNTYGPRMNAGDGRVIVQFIRQALRNENLKIYGSGKQTRSFCYIDDLIHGISLYANSNLIEPINLGRIEEIQILDLANLILQLTESKSALIYSELPADDPPRRIPDLQLAELKLIYKSEIPLRTGLISLIKALKS